MSDTHNCPNCGAVVHDCICDYCGTVFPSSTNAFIGKKCMLVAVDDDNRVFIMGLNVHSIERREPEHYCTCNTTRSISFTDELTFDGTTCDLPATAHGLRELKNVFNEKFSDL